jgi:hypothetical protein
LCLKNRGLFIGMAPKLNLNELEGFRQV